MKWNFQKSLHNRESRDIFFFSCNPCSNTIPFGFGGKDTFFFFLKSISRSEYEKPFERIAILFFFFKPERVKIFRCKSKSKPFLPFFLSFFFFPAILVVVLSHGIGAHILSKSRPSSCVLFQPWYKHKGMAKEWSMIFARVCICAGSISVHWIKTIRNIWANDWYFYVAFETVVYGNEEREEERRKEEEAEEEREEKEQKCPTFRGTLECSYFRSNRFVQL